MLDIKLLRDQPELFDSAMQKRGIDINSSILLDLDKKHREVLTSLQEYQSLRNQNARLFGEAKKKQEPTEHLSAQSEDIKAKIQDLEGRADAYKTELTNFLVSLPNFPDASVPVGKDEEANLEIRKWGTPRDFSFNPKSHFDLGETLGMMDFERASKLSGSRFVILTEDLARLERAVAAFMLDVHTKEFGYKEVSAPVLVNEKALFGTGQLPKFGEDQFQTTFGPWLIPTAEVSLTNIFAEEMNSEANLPLRVTTFSLCFRAEAGAAGRDTRGMMRLHQFNKVELVSITTPEASDAEHERMTKCAGAILEKLNLPYRVMLLSSGDMGFCAQKTYDLEVWVPSQNMYREISSCSNCGSFQARRMNARFSRQDGTKDFVHTLNGSGLAVGRTIIAILENYQQEDGSIAIPEALQSYMNGQKVIKKL